MGDSKLLEKLAKEIERATEGEVKAREVLDGKVNLANIITLAEKALMESDEIYSSRREVLEEYLDHMKGLYGSELSEQDLRRFISRDYEVLALRKFENSREKMERKFFEIEFILSNRARGKLYTDPKLIERAYSWFRKLIDDMWIFRISVQKEVYRCAMLISSEDDLKIAKKLTMDEIFDVVELSDMEKKLKLFEQSAFHVSEIMIEDRPVKVFYAPPEVQDMFLVFHPWQRKVFVRINKRELEGMHELRRRSLEYLAAISKYVFDVLSRNSEMGYLNLKKAYEMRYSQILWDIYSEPSIYTALLINTAYTEDNPEARKEAIRSKWRILERNRRNQDLRRKLYLEILEEMKDELLGYTEISQSLLIEKAIEYAERIAKHVEAALFIF